MHPQGRPAAMSCPTDNDPAEFTDTEFPETEDFQSETSGPSPLPELDLSNFVLQSIPSDHATAIEILISEFRNGSQSFPTREEIRRRFPELAAQIEAILYPEAGSAPEGE